MTQHLDKAKSLFDQNKFEEALKTINKVLEKSSYDIDALYLRALTNRRLDKHDKSLTDFDAILNLMPNEAEFYSERGVTYFHLKLAIPALADMDKAVEIEPNNPYRYSSRAFIKGTMKDIEGAIIDYKKTIELDPEDAIAYNNLGLLEEQLGRMDSAQQLFQKADAASQKNPETKNFYTAPKKENSEINNDLKSTAKNENNGSVLRTMTDVLRSKETFKEFTAFIKNGFKLKK